MGALPAQGKMANVRGNGSGVQRKSNGEDPIFPHAQGIIKIEENSDYYITAVYTTEGEPYTNDNFDTLWSIAIRCGTTVEEIKRLNQGIVATNLFQGQRILIKGDPLTIEEEDIYLDPDHAQGSVIIEGECIYYKTAIHNKEGALYSQDKFDTFWSIAIRTRTTVEEIKRLNPDVDPNNLIQGQMILIKDDCITKDQTEKSNNIGVAPSWCGPTKPRLYWDNNPDIELAMFGEDLKQTVIYKTVGIHSNDKYFQNAHTMFVAHTYGDIGYWESNVVENFYFYDNGISKWVEFDPNEIGMNADEVTNLALYSIGGTAVIVGGLILLESGLVITSVEEILAKASLDALDQYIITGGDFDKIDWANVAASGFIKNTHLKNIIAAAIDYKVEEGGFNTDKEMEDIVVEFLIRTGADVLFKKYARDTGSWNDKMGEDLLKKLLRNQVKEVYKETIGDETNE